MYLYWFQCVTHINLLIVFEDSATQAQLFSFSVAGTLFTSLPNQPCGGLVEPPTAVRNRKLKRPHCFQSGLRSYHYFDSYSVLPLGSYPRGLSKSRISVSRFSSALGTGSAGASSTASSSFFIEFIALMPTNTARAIITKSITV